MATLNRPVTYIVSGTRAEFEHYMFRKYNEGTQAENYVFVDGPHVFIGKKEVHGFFIGTYENRADIDHIKDMIACANYKYGVNKSANNHP